MIALQRFADWIETQPKQNGKTSRMFSPSTPHIQDCLVHKIQHRKEKQSHHFYPSGLAPSPDMIGQELPGLCMLPSFLPWEE